MISTVRRLEQMKRIMETEVNGRNWLPLGLILACLSLATGCAMGEGNISDRLPSGVVIPLSDLPIEVMNAEERLRLPDGTRIQKCNDGSLYRFDYPDGTIWMKNAAGHDVGGVI
ncbi:MAG: hypothetical protein R3C53_28685 [Pirellulaceae bacterium]